MPPTNQSLPTLTLILYRRSRCSFQAGTPSEKELWFAPFRIPGDISQAHVDCTMSFFAQELPYIHTACFWTKPPPTSRSAETRLPGYGTTCTCRPRMHMHIAHKAAIFASARNLTNLSKKIKTTSANRQPPSAREVQIRKSKLARGYQPTQQRSGAPTVYRGMQQSRRSFPDLERALFFTPPV